MVGALAGELKVLAFCFRQPIVQAVAEHRLGRKMSHGCDLGKTPHNHMSPPLLYGPKPWHPWQHR